MRIHDEIAHLRGAATGTIAIGLSTVPHIALLPRVLQKFRLRYPEVRLRITEGLFPAVAGDVREGLPDFYVGPFGEEQRPALVTVEPFFCNSRLIFARRGHPLADVCSMADLVNAQWVTGALAPVSEDELRSLFSRLNLPPLIVVVEGRTSLTMIAVAGSSDLLMMLPRQWKTPLEATGIVRAIPIAEPLEAPTICIVRRSAILLTPTAEHLTDLFRRAAISYARTTTGIALLTA